MDSTVASILTTTPFFKPLESDCPRPMTSWRPSDNTSATTATTLEVPMSRPTIKFFASLVISFRFILFPCQTGQHQSVVFERHAIRIAQIHILNLPVHLLQQLRIDPNQSHDPIAHGVFILLA